MSVLGWDGFTLAADRAVFRSGVVSPVEKIFENATHAAGFVGQYATGAAMAAWALEGARPDRWDAAWDKNEVILVEKATGRAYCFDGYYIGLELHQPTVTGEQAASAALLGMMLVGVPVEMAVETMVRSGRFDAVGFGTQFVKVRERPVTAVPEPDAAEAAPEPVVDDSPMVPGSLRDAEAEVVG